MGTKVPQEPNQQFSEKQNKSLSLGLVGALFGLKGFVKVKPFSGESSHFSRLKDVTLRQGEKEETREVAEVVSQGKTLLLRFAGVDNPEAARLLEGAEIVAGRDYAAPLREGEFYVEDLKGLEVISEKGEVLGKITDVVDGGGGSLAEIKLPSGEKRFTPFRNEFFGDVDLQKGKIVLLEPWILE